jgi:hypothetical protein
LFVIACSTPALDLVHTDNHEHDVMLGLRVLAVGWTGLFVGQFAWFANLFLLLAVVPFLLRWWITTAVILLIGISIATHTFALFGRILPADEGNVRKMYLESIGVGFYFWLASFVLPLAGALWLRMIASPSRPR